MSFVELNINEHFPSAVIVHQHQPDHFVMKCTIMDFMTPINTVIKRWKYNRPADDIRCIDFAKSICKNRAEMDTMIYANYVSNENTVEIVDGMHRHRALQIILENNELFGNTEWLFQKYIFVNVRVDFTDGQLQDLFMNINKSVPVPDLYLGVNDGEENQKKLKIIEEIVREYQTKYKQHFSHCVKCNSPNVNREIYIEWLNEFYQNLQELNPNSSPEKIKKLLMQQLVQLNENIKQLVLNETNHTLEIARVICRNSVVKKYKITNNSIQKCVNSGCWLFLFKFNVFPEIVGF